MSPKTRAHENAVAWLARWLMLAVSPERHEVRVTSPLTLEESEPEPDLAVIPADSPRPYHPSAADLVIEVASSSLSRDLEFKPGVYGRAGIAEYWAFDLESRRALVHRDPNPRGYADLIEASERGQVAAKAVDLPPLAVAEVLRAADA